MANLRKEARGRECQVRIYGVCNNEIDRRTRILDNNDARLYHLEGVIRTQAILLKEGKIKS